MTFDAAAVQGNILRGYRLPVVAHLFGRIERADSDAWRRFLRSLEAMLTWTVDYGSAKPDFTINFGVSFTGLELLQPQIAAEVAARFPAFGAGMPRRAKMLGDPEGRYDAWNDRHLWVSVHARDRRSVEAGTAAVRGLAPRLLLEQQEPLGEAIAKTGQDGKVHWFEHFGFRDDISSPAVAGTPKLRLSDVDGRGKYDPDTGTWNPIATGEFILGEVDESGVNALDGLSTRSAGLLKHGTFAVFRRLRQDVRTFRQYLRQQTNNDGESAALAASMMGRQHNGEPLAAPTKDLKTFHYRDDGHGARCPLGAHVRRVNPRETGRHQLIRRGITFGPEAPANLDDVAPGQADERGLWFVAFNANIEEQFEFMQKQWINGPAGTLMDASDPIAGASPARSFAVEGDVDTGRLPRICLDIPRFVTPQGGQYYFVPSRNGLQSLSAP